jgi:DNA-binding CsgD family transcriptional regulator/tetratricopeptide (TPR) repeat protein
VKAAVRGEAARIAGRTRERELLRRVIGGSVRGDPCTVLVHGEPGVGKTRLVTAMTDHARLGGHAVLWGRCLRFGATSSSYLPFISALEGALADGLPLEDVDLELLYGDPGGAEPVPRALHVVDRTLARLAERMPVVLVVDDLQWADGSSLDTLAYLVAGMRRRPVAILVTYRDTGLPDGHPLHAWVADMLRLPDVEDLLLGRLGEDETAEQLEQLLGGRPRPELVTQVWERSGGNPYLTELLAGALEPGADALPHDIPTALRSALTAQWHGLDPDARKVTQVLSVAGRPVDPEVLAGVLSAGDVDVDAALHRAETGGVAERSRDGRVWFRHPLLADVLDATLLPDEKRALHRAFVQVLSAAPARGTRAPGDLALHLAGAAMYDEAFVAALDASDEAARGEAFSESAVLLRQATDLWSLVTPQVRDHRGGLADLLWEAADRSFLAGDVAGALAAVERARPLADDPALAARLLLLRVQLRHAALLYATPPVPDLEEAVTVARQAPDSPELAFCLSELSEHQQWSGDVPAARRSAAESLEVADRSGHPGARASALIALANANSDDPGSEELAREAGRLAAEAGRRELAGIAAIALSNVLESQGRFSEAADVLAAASEQCQRIALRGLLGTYAALYMIPLGRLAEARTTLREVVASRPRGITGLQARAAAMVVAVRTGDLHEAGLHLDRLRELAPEFEVHTGMHGPSALAEYLLAVGRPQQALDVLERTIEGHSISEPRYGDDLLLWAARAAHALPARARRSALDRVIAARERARVRPFRARDGDPTQRAVKALYVAETARCLGEPDAEQRWREAIPLADAAGLRFAAAEGRLRLAEVLLTARRRQEGAGFLREAVVMAEEMSALRLRDEVLAVASAARVGLGDPAPPVRTVADPHGLTGREREVLGHLVAGRSYAEIAKALVISEKTVSVHVSNLLRKTGTSSRTEVASWARSSGAVAGWER